jgi:hypothetical protein
VDARGTSLSARPLVGEFCANGASLKDIQEQSNNNTSFEAQISLGEEWTQRALGEHASIASFSAFSIALMTNGAPSILVQEALVAAMDEARHAHTSFDIAGALLGREVTAGPLPESTHEFQHDLVKLGLAVAREGCVDETLSALAAAVESLELSEGGGKYNVLDVSTATWIEDELNTIALEEATHSALAWRTLFWVCSVDTEACNTVKRDVLDVKELETRFDYRFANSFEKKPNLLEEMQIAWRRVYEKLGSLDSSSRELDEDLCSKSQQHGGENNILWKLTDNILRGALCNTKDAVQILPFASL